jgi:hypothetical protein
MIIRSKTTLLDIDIPAIDKSINSLRCQDLWQTNNEIKKIAIKEKILITLEMLYGRPMRPFQTLNFKQSPVQAWHQDFSHFATINNYMCGVQTLLQDVDEDQGPLKVLVGSHKLGPLFYDDIGITARVDEHTDPNTYSTGAYRRYEEYLERYTDKYPIKKFTGRKGDIIIWHGSLLHGSPLLGDPKPMRSRLSQVVHYLGTDLAYFTPMFSYPKENAYYMRNPIDLGTGLPFKSIEGLSTPPCHIQSRSSIFVKGEPLSW